MKQALVFGQLVPQREVALADAVVLRAVLHGDFAQIQQRVLVLSTIIRQNELTEHTPQQLLVDGHEERTEVELTYPGILRPLARHTLHPFFQEPHGTERAIPLAAVERHVATAHEQLLQQRLDAEDNPVLHNAVDEMSRKDFTELRELHHEALRCLRLVGTGLHRQSQFHQYLLTDAELRAMHTRLLPPAAVVRRLYPSRQFFFSKCCHRPAHVTVVLVVVVRVTIVEVHVPTVVTVVLSHTPQVRSGQCVRCLVLNKCRSTCGTPI